MTKVLSQEATTWEANRQLLAVVSFPPTTLTSYK